ncbi:hypothetical protein EDD86DRAFT_186399 [Gorgonomyces haynaldii]|nr:hypothetical protein EDD86DRAFT_186399 [Gorgonomyces haynaldii]
MLGSQRLKRALRYLSRHWNTSLAFCTGPKHFKSNQADIRYLSIKYTLTKNDRIWFAQLYLFLLQSTQDLDLLSLFSTVTTKLIQNEKLIDDHDLVIDWKPLHTLLENLTYPKQKDIDFPKISTTMRDVVKLVIASRRFFEPASFQLIMEHNLPFIDLGNLNDALARIALLTLCLPTTKAPPTGWLNGLFSIWSLYCNVTVFDMQFIELFGRLSKDQRDSPLNISWTPDQIKTMYNGAIRTFDLPVGMSDGSKLGETQLAMPSNVAEALKANQMDNFGYFCVYTIFPLQLNRYPEARRCFDQFIFSLENFSNPSNAGRWSFPIAKLCASIATALYDRATYEKTQECKTPQECKIDKESVDMIVQRLKSLAFVLLYAKDPRVVSVTCTTLRCLAWMSPELIIPELLDAAYPALESLTETNRTVSILTALTSLALPMLDRDHFPSGAQHLLPLLHLALPGIDLNDSWKTMTSLSFISVACSVVYVSDQSTLSLVMESEQDELARISTAQFESWLLHFCDRCFSLFSNLPQLYGVGDTKRTSEDMILKQIQHTFEVIFAQLSPELEDVVLQYFVNYFRRNQSHGAAKCFGIICGKLSARNPHKRLKSFVPLCVSTISDELEMGACSKQGNTKTSNLPFGYTTMADASTHWYQCVLFNVVTMSGPDLVNYESEITRLIDLSIEKCQSPRGYKWSFKLLRRVCQSLTTVYPLQISSLHGKPFTSQDVRDWGKIPDLKDVKMEWHQPNQKEVQMAERLVKRYLGLVEKEIKSDKQKMMMSLLINLTYSMASLFKPQTSMSHNNETQDLALYSPRYERTPFHPLDPQLLSVDFTLFERVQRLLLDLSQHVLNVGVDDVELAKQVIKCIRIHINSKGRQARDLAYLRNVYAYFKMITKTVSSVKKMPPYLLAMRAFSLHGEHLNATAFCPTTDLVKKLMMKLFELSISKYAAVRKEAQDALNSALNFHAVVKFDVFREMLEKIPLHGQTYDVDSYKGALYLLGTSFMKGLYLYKVAFTKQFFVRLLTSQTEDKQSILERLRYIYNDFMSRFSGLIFENQINDQALEISKRVQVNPKRLQEQQALSQERTRVQEEEYTSLIETLGSILKTNLHWRIKHLIVRFLRVFVRQERDIPSSVAAYCVDGMLDEHPELRKQAVRLTVRLLIAIKDQKKASQSIIRVLDQKSIEAFHLEKNPFPKDVYLDRHQFGSLCWPKSLKGYLMDHPPLDMSSPIQSYHIIQKQVQNPEFWQKLFEFNALESGKIVERFDTDNAELFKRLFTIYQDTLLDKCIPTLKSQVSKIAENSSQRAAAELVGGILRGSKHWSLAQMERLWSVILNLIMSALQQATTQSFPYWIEAIKYGGSNRDIRRFTPLVDAIFALEHDASSQSFFQEAKKLHLIRGLVSTFSWKLKDYHPRIAEIVLLYRQSPYQQIRESLGVLVNELASQQLKPQILDAKKLLQSDWIDACYGKPLSQNLQVLFDVDLTGTNNNASKTLLSWYASAFQSARGPSICCATSKLLDHVLVMRELSDTDLQTMAGEIMKLYCNVVYTSWTVGKAVDKFVQLMRQDMDWQRKNRCLNMIQVFFFRNLGLLSQEMQDALFEAVLERLFEPQLEVRQLAGMTISGMVRCSKRQVNDLVDRFTFILSKTRITKDKNQTILIERHGAVLGLAAILLAFPYQVPEWMPPVLVTLASSSGNPYPISTTISQTFAEFKRTHQDTWAIDKQQFTSEQLDVLADLLLPPSYYA